MFCSSCGKNLEPGVGFCTNCGAPAPSAASVNAIPPAAAAQPLAAAPPLPGAAPPPPPVPAAPIAYGAPPRYVPPQYVPPQLMFPYAGFWLRFVAYVIDGLIIGVVAVPLAIFLIIVTGAGSALAHMGNQSPENFVFPAAFIIFLVLLIPLVVCGEWLYFAMTESSNWQATPGKKAMGLIVTDMEGKRLTFGHASGRFFAKIVTGLVPLAIGWIMAGFTEKKQALHDFIAGTLVLKRV